MSDHPLAQVVGTWHTTVAATIGKLLIEKPEGFTRQEVIEQVYGRHAHSRSNENVSLSMRRVRRRLNSLGWDVPKPKGSRKALGLYVLVKLP